VVGVFGVRGEVRLHLHNRSSDLLSDGREVLLVDEDDGRRRVRTSTRPGAGGRVLGRLDGVGDREAARALIGHELVIAKADLPDTDDDVYYHHELLGLEVVTSSGRALGRLAEIHGGSGVDVWVVRGEQEHFLPALAEVFLEVDPARGWAVVADDAVEP